MAAKTNRKTISLTNRKTRVIGYSGDRLMVFIRALFPCVSQGKHIQQ